MPPLHRIPKKQLDTNIFFVQDDLSRIDGLDRTTLQVHDHLHDEGDLQGYHRGSNVAFDPTTSALASNTVQHAVAEFANKPFAKPVHETSAGVIGVAYYQVLASDLAYVGVPGEDPNAVFAVYDTEGIELDIQVLDVTSDFAGTASVLGNTWHAQPYIQLSAIPAQQILVKYGTQSTLSTLPINAFLKEGVIAAEVDSEVVDAIAEIKGTAWDVAVPVTRNLVGLDARIGVMEPLAHIHRYNVPVLGLMDGINDTFALPFTEKYVATSLQVYLSGVRLPSTSFLEITPFNTFQLLVHPEQLPDASVQDTLEVDYHFDGVL